MTDMTPFTYEGAEIRTLRIDDEPWFVVADVCEYFGVTNRNRIMQQIDAESKGGTQIDTPGGRQQAAIIDEAGLYHFLFLLQPTKARGVPAAEIEARDQLVKKFRRWVTADVLPAIRKTGSYAIAPQFDIPTTLAGALRLAADQAEMVEVERARADKAETKVAVLEPAANAWESFAEEADDWDVRAAAQILMRDPRITGLGQERLFKQLVAWGWLDRQRRPYQAQIDNGRLAVRVRRGKNRKTGYAYDTTQVRITAKGLKEIRRRLTLNIIDSPVQLDFSGRPYGI